ncbi:MAG: Hsp70 family protein, partial [Candidatus Gracilibacteria bacterium]|nr:Hsp70 family protein [Candidatus Gracilibacteria bacterium]
MASDNKSLGRFMLDSIAPAPRGVPQIEVTFDIDANGVLKVKAKDKGTGKEQHITIAGSTGMDDKEVDRLVKEAEAKRDEDKKRKEAVEARNMAESATYQAEKTINDNKDKISDDDKKSAEEKIKELKDILANNETSKEELDAKTKELNDIMMKIGQAIYSQTGDQEAPKADDGVVDGDVETDGDDKNTTRV